jgi:hypothetical protein
MTTRDFLFFLAGIPCGALSLIVYCWWRLVRHMDETEYDFSAERPKKSDLSCSSVDTEVNFR